MWTKRKARKCSRRRKTKSMDTCSGCRWRVSSSPGAAVWKVHYVTPIFNPPGAHACYETEYCQCVGENVTYHDPPLLFDLSRDPSESTPLTNDVEPFYDLVIHTVANAVLEHKKSITPVAFQLRKEMNHEFVSLLSCCGVFPFCLCDKEEGENNTIRLVNWLGAGSRRPPTLAQSKEQGMDLTANKFL